MGRMRPVKANCVGVFNIEHQIELTENTMQREQNNIVLSQTMGKQCLYHGNLVSNLNTRLDYIIVVLCAKCGCVQILFHDVNTVCTALFQVCALCMVGA